MFNEGPRPTYYDKPTTGENVGPNTYVVCNIRSRKPYCAPFLSSTAKSTSLVNKINTDAVYDVRPIRNKIKGGASPKNKTTRFVYNNRDSTPGPTHYKAKPIKCEKISLKLDPTKPKLYACHVPYTTTVTAPSIPTKRDENGYDIALDGTIIKVPWQSPESMEINIKSTLESNKGFRFGCRTAKRFVKKQFHTTGPGPAAYSRELPKCRRSEEDEKFRQMKRLFSFIPRFVEEQEMKACKEKLPGPGYYSPTKECCQMAESINPKPFIAAKTRFKYNEGDSPGPATYKVCECFKKHRKFSTKCVPFGYEASRFETKKLEKIPGPADYELKTFIQEKLDRHMNKFTTVCPPFNNTAQRVFFRNKEAKFMPSAADYPTDKCVEDTSLEIFSSVFLNAVERFDTPGFKANSVSPDAYNVAESFAKNFKRKCHSVGMVAFNSSGPRSKTPAFRTDVPCPTSYELGLSLCTPGIHFSTVPRYSCDEETPGPGSYNIHPQHETAIHKAQETYNLKLKENVLKKKLRFAPKETRRKWCKELRKRRFLNWFDVKLDYEERMVLLIQKLFDKPI